MFLSDEHFADNFQKVTHPAAAIASQLAEARQAPIHFIFHTAFCCSTLMLKAIDIPGRTLGLKEPDVLINLANCFIRSDDQGNGERLDLVLHLLARPFEAGGEHHREADELRQPARDAGARSASRQPRSSALLRRQAAPSLDPEAGHVGTNWGRRLFRSAAAWASLHFGFSEEDTFVLTDLQALGLGWLLQMHHFSEVAHQMGDRVIMIDSADFLEGPGPTLQRVSDLFELELDELQIAEIVTGPAFARHSKFSDQDYGSEERAADQNAAEAAHSEELEMVVKWVEAVAAHLNVELRPAARTPVN